MGELAIIYGVLAIVIIGAQFFLYKKPDNTGIFFLNVAIALIIGFISFSSRASNDMIQRVAALALGAFSLLAFIPRFIGTKNFSLSNILVTVSVIGGFIYLFL